mmetsp:Transcript_142890/g.456453  ORF Transcript_142890/g.456453 Transcript_142890/m.456453 type:complete len:206 (+) Transcript_142890:1638-2255(+)
MLLATYYEVQVVRPLLLMMITISLPQKPVTFGTSTRDQHLVAVLLVKPSIQCLNSARPIHSLHAPIIHLLELRRDVHSHRRRRFRLACCKQFQSLESVELRLCLFLRNLPPKLFCDYLIVPCLVVLTPCGIVAQDQIRVLDLDENELILCSCGLVHAGRLVGVVDQRKLTVCLFHPVLHFVLIYTKDAVVVDAGIKVEAFLGFPI